MYVISSPLQGHSKGHLVYVYLCDYTHTRVRINISFKIPTNKILIK